MQRADWVPPKPFPTVQSTNDSPNFQKLQTVPRRHLFVGNDRVEENVASLPRINWSETLVLSVTNLDGRRGYFVARGVTRQPPLPLRNVNKLFILSDPNTRGQEGTRCAALGSYIMLAIVKGSCCGEIIPVVAQDKTPQVHEPPPTPHYHFLVFRRTGLTLAHTARVKSAKYASACSILNHTLRCRETSRSFLRKLVGKPRERFPVGKSVTKGGFTRRSYLSAG